MRANEDALARGGALRLAVEVRTANERANGRARTVRPSLGLFVEHDFDSDDDDGTIDRSIDRDDDGSR